MYNKNKVPLGIWLRIRGYLADAASLINDYLFRQYSTRRQWADQASSHGQDTAIAFDKVYALASALTDMRQLRASRLAIQNWIIAFTVSKIVVIQSVARRWLTQLRIKSRDQGPDFDVLEEIYEECDIITIQRWWRSRYAAKTSVISGGEDVDDAVVLTASEAVSATTRLSGASRQFRSAITFLVEKDWLSGWRSWITVFDTAAMINMVAESVVDSTWKYVDGNNAWSTVTSVDGVKIGVGGRVIIPGHSMVLNGRIIPMVATVVK